MSLIPRSFPVLLTLVLAPVLANAHPYASGISNNAGNISFILNENADNVTVVFDAGGAGNTNNLGAVAKGVGSFPLGGHTSYSIIVSKAGSGSISQISSDANPFCQYFGPRGVAVNNNPKTRNFGRIYIPNANPNTVPGGRTTTKGLYVINADQSDAIGQGNTAKTAGVTWNTTGGGSVGNTYSPYRLSVGPDDSVFVSEAMSNTCTIYMIDPDLNTATMLLGPAGLVTPGSTINNPGVAQTSHGRPVSKPAAFGSLAAGTLVLYDIDCELNSVANQIQKYVINNGPAPWTTAPSASLGTAGNAGSFVDSDLAIAPDGKFFAQQNRANFATVGPTSLRVYDTDGTTLLWDDLSANNNAGTLLVNSRGVAVSPDGKYVALVVGNTGNFLLMKTTNGLPDLSTLYTNNLAADGGTARGVAFDMADNLYTSSGGSDRLRIFSLGLTTTCVTSNDATATNGSFTLTVPNTTVSVTATASQASQNHGSPVAGVFTLSRSGQTTGPLTVNFSLTGTATSGVYTASATTSITFSGTDATTNVIITPVADNTPRLTNTVILTILGGAGYNPAAPLSDTVYIQNTATQQLVIVTGGIRTMYKPFSNDFVSFLVTRLGDATTPAYTVSNINYAGTAVVNTDFLPAFFTVNPGDITVTATISNSPNYAPGPYVGNKTIIATLGPNIAYTTLPGSNTMTILDNAYPSAALLYTNALADPNDAMNWNITFGDGDSQGNPNNYSADFGYDITANNGNSFFNGWVGSPPGGATNALRLSVNKNFSPGSAAGVNLYYTNQIFSNSYAVRFNMNLIQSSTYATATEGALCGINHNGLQTNWWLGSGTNFGGPWASDGIWYWISSDALGAASGDYREFTGTNGVLPNTGFQALASQSSVTFVNSFKHGPGPYTSLKTNGTNGPGSGVPANGSSRVSADNSNWSDVEIKHVKNVVTLTIDKTTIFSYTNATTFTNGYLMLGYSDPFASVGQPDGAVYLANLRVVALAPPVITGISVVGTNVALTFTSSDGDDTTASFALQGAPAVSGAYTDIPGATIAQLPSGAFRATTSSSAAQQFYRLRHK